MKEIQSSYLDFVQITEILQNVGTEIKKNPLKFVFYNFPHLIFVIAVPQDAVRFDDVDESCSSSVSHATGELHSEGQHGPQDSILDRNGTPSFKRNHEDDHLS